MLGRSVLITGGTGALGTAVTEAAIGRNARVTVTYIDTDEKDRLAGSLTTAERALATFVQADLRDQAAVDRLFETVSHVDVLLHLVGGFEGGATEHFSVDRFYELIDSNLKTTFLVCRRVLPMMIAAGFGRIVTVASTAAETPLAGMAVYAAAKAGVIAFTRAISEEAMGHDVTANCVAPAAMDTPANRERFPELDPAMLVPPGAVAEIIAYLGSSVAGHLRGTAIDIRGAHGSVAPSLVQTV